MKQTIEIEVPEGKKAIWENNQIIFVDAEPHWKSIKTFDDVFNYCYDNNFYKYTTNYGLTKSGTYEEKVAKLRLVIAALTDNEKLSFVEGDLYFPVVQLYSKYDINNCDKNRIIGKIKAEGKEYTVVGGYGSHSSIAGLYSIGSPYGLAFADSYVSFLQVSSIEIAKHLSTYFGKLIFEVLYGGSNCDWEWIE